MDWKVWKWKIHWQIALALVAGVGVGFLLHFLDPEPTLGIESVDADGRVTAIDPAVDGVKLRPGDVVLSVADREVAPGTPPDKVLRRSEAGGTVRARIIRDDEEMAVRTPVALGPDSPRAWALWPFHFLAELFLRLLQMLIVPLIVTSLVSGVTSLGNLGALGRMGLKTILYYVTTSLLAVLVGLAFVNAIQPGRDAEIPLEETLEPGELTGEADLWGIFLRMVPENVFGALTDNGSILQVIFFSLLAGVFIVRVGGESGEILKRFFQAGFEVMMRLAEFVLLFIPVGVLALVVRVVGMSGFEPFGPLLLFMLTVVLALAVHSLVTLPLLLFLVARVDPRRWARAVAPALMTAFSTSSSSVTLPVTLRSVEERGRVSNKTSSFVLPLGATINMDGTALYECVGVIFLAQYYASSAGFELTFAKQALVVVTALLASIGAAGIPSAGLVMMTTILSALELPLEGVVLLLTVDRPLDMLRTSINIWSDTTCAAVIARTEGEGDIAGSRNYNPLGEEPPGRRRPGRTGRKTV